VVLADLVARTVMRPAELPLGAVTALIGVPFFLWRLRQTVAR
jgi:iron complex transport system permease protein